MYWQGWMLHHDGQASSNKSADVSPSLHPSGLVFITQSGPHQMSPPLDVLFLATLHKLCKWARRPSSILQFFPTLWALYSPIITTNPKQHHCAQNETQLRKQINQIREEIANTQIRRCLFIRPPSWICPSTILTLSGNLLFKQSNDIYNIFSMLHNWNNSIEDDLSFVGIYYGRNWAWFVQFLWRSLDVLVTIKCQPCGWRGIIVKSQFQPQNLQKKRQNGLRIFQTM